ncbi:putative Ig domain-containing protein [Candidatus Poriferisocius sp.]|uniref:putative Ig domain-containing protein n=1 Tax=Candidatus Poriferisocius sp. TaxID=3101276 RepID=UPI003B0130FF
MPTHSHQRSTAWLTSLGALVLLAALTLIVLGWPASGDSTVTVTQGDFTLTCDATVAEGGTLACTLTNTSATAEAWPVVAILHLSDDTDRALVVGSPIDAAFAARQPAAALDSGVEWIGDTLVGYSRFDWSGSADAAPDTTQESTSSPSANARTVNIAIPDDALQEGAERFYVALGPDGSRGVGLLSTNKAAVTITEYDARSSNASLTSLSVTAGGSQHTLSPTSTAAQTVNVGYQVTEATLTAETAHQRAAMTIAATYDSSSVVLAAGGVTSLAMTSGEQSASVPLGVGTTSVTLTVTAENGTVAAHPINIVRSDIGDATTVNVTLYDFVLSCPAEAEEGTDMECTLTNTSSTSQLWPVVAVLHSAIDEMRALVSEDPVIADVDPAYSKDLTLGMQTPERDGFNHGYGELFSGGSRRVYRIWGYEKFDWEGSAGAGDKRTVIIELHDNSATADDDGETEVFYVALAPSDYGGLSQLTENTAPILLRHEIDSGPPLSLSFGDDAVSLLETVDRVWTVGARVDRGTPDGGLDRLPEAEPVVPSGTSRFELTYSAAGLPEGLSMGNDRVIRGTPVAATDGEVTVTFTATGRAEDVNGNQIGEAATASLEFGVTVLPPVVFDPASLSFFTNDILEYTVGQAAPLNVVFPRASGGEGPLEYWLDNWEPRVPISNFATGLSYDPAERALTSGTGNEAPEAGQSYALVYWAEDRNGARAVAYGSITVSAPPTLPDIADKTVTVGQPVSIELPEATGGSKRIVWLRYRMEPEIPGLGFNSRTRTLSGTPTLAGQTQVTYTVTDRNGVSDSATFTVEVEAGDLAPAAPQISARAFPASGIALLDWDDVDDATGYVVQLRAEDAVYPSFAADSVPDQASLLVYPSRVQNEDGSTMRAVVFGLSDGSYKVRVAAANAHGTGPWSPEASVTLTPE